MALQQFAASPDYDLAKLPPPPPLPPSPSPSPSPPPPAAVKQLPRKQTYTSTTTDQQQQQRRPVATAPPGSVYGPAGQQHDDGIGGGRVVEGFVLVLRATAAAAGFVAMALVASCRHGDWMDFTRYQEYRYLLGVAVAAFLYSSLQALRSFRRMRGGHAAASCFLDFAGDQAVAYLLVTAAAASLPITIRMRSAVANAFTDAMAASIVLCFVAFAALALSALLSGCSLVSTR